MINWPDELDTTRPYSARCGAVERELRAVLATIPAGEYRTTREIVALLWPSENHPYAVYSRLIGHVSRLAQIFPVKYVYEEAQKGPHAGKQVKRYLWPHVPLDNAAPVVNTLEARVARIERHLGFSMEDSK